MPGENEHWGRPLLLIFPDWDRNLAVFEWQQVVTWQVQHRIFTDSNCAREDMTKSVWKGNGTSHSGSYLYRLQHSDKINSGNQAEGQNSKGLSDEVNSKRDASVSF